MSLKLTSFVLSLSFFLSSGVLTPAAQASTHFTSGNDLNCILEVWGDFTTSVDNDQQDYAAGITATSSGDASFPALFHFKGSLSQGMHVAVSPTLKDFIATSDDQNGQQAEDDKILPLVDKLDIQVDVTFANGVLGTSLSGGGQTQKKSFTTNWNVPNTAYSIGAESDITVKMDSAFKKNDSILLQLTCYPGAKQ